MRRTAHLSAALLLTALVLTGCTTPTPMPTAPPEPSIAPVFASDEEALAAAEEAYGRFLATLDQIFIDGGSDPERLRQVASEEIFLHESGGFEQLRREGLRGVGATTSTLTFQSANLTAGEVTVYACDDISGTDIVDAAGNSVVADRRVVQYQYEVLLGENPMIVRSRTPWDGSSVCA